MSLDELEDEYATAAFYIEKELHQIVGPDYPAAKFFVAIEELKKHNEREQKEMDKSRSGRSTIG